MDGDRQPAAAASVAAVLGDDDLLREILLRLGFPNYLVRAALVSKRWLLHASDPAFLRRFRDRHPPRLLGFCAGYPGRYRFVPFPHPPELAAVSRRAASSCNDAFAAGRGQRIKHCRNGRLITGFFLSSEGRFRAGGEVSAEVYVLGSGGWGVPTTAVTELELPYEHTTTSLRALLPPVHGKVFLVTSIGCILGLDLATASFFTLELPAGVGRNYKISCAKGSGLYLVTTDGFRLNVWLHKMMGHDDAAGGWLLVDTFCVREACTHLAGHNQVLEDGDFVAVAAVGDNVECVFLNHAASGVVLYVHLRSRVVEKVHDQHDFGYPPFGCIQISPLMMTWPPIFPALTNDMI